VFVASGKQAACDLLWCHLQTSNGLKILAKASPPSAKQIPPGLAWGQSPDASRLLRQHRHPRGRWIRLAVAEKARSPLQRVARFRQRLPTSSRSPPVRTDNFPRFQGANSGGSRAVQPQLIGTPGTRQRHTAMCAGTATTPSRQRIHERGAAACPRCAACHGRALAISAARRPHRQGPPACGRCGPR